MGFAQGDRKIESNKTWLIRETDYGPPHEIEDGIYKNTQYLTGITPNNE